MRITDRILQANFLNNLSNVRSQLSEKQEKLATGKNINRPSDDPLGTARLLRLNSEIENITTYNNSIDEGMAFVNTTTSALEGIQNESSRLLTYLTSARDATKDVKDFAPKVQAAIDNILSYANIKYGGKYIFGGTDHTHVPYGLDATSSFVEEKTSHLDGTQKIRVSSSSTIQVNIPGRDVFGTVGNPPGTDIFNSLIDIRDRLAAGESPTNADLETINSFNDHVLSELTVVGNMYNRLSDAKTLLETQRQDVETLMGKVQEVDIARAIVDMKDLQSSMDRTLQISSYVLPKSLLDYL
jgi:flagellar hook-associated protein 3 FlgL